MLLKWIFILWFLFTSYIVKKRLQRKGQAMRTRLHLLWKKVKRHPWVFLATIVGITLIVVFILGYVLNWGWTGLGPYTPPTKNSNLQRGKTLWDWLQLLVIPIMLAIGGFWLNQLQKSRDEKAAEERAIVERVAAEKRAQTEQEIAEDTRREETLQTYLNKISELIFDRGLHRKIPDAIGWDVARILTMTVLRRLDIDRKKIVIQFLSEASLLAENCITLKGADLKKIDLSRAILTGVNLNEVDLSEANLHGAKLDGANLVKANLSGANLSGALLSRVNLSEANLSGANLHRVIFFNQKAYLDGANLSGADLNGVNLENVDLDETNLSGANLNNTNVTTEQLDKAKSLEGATMPDGTKHT